MFQLLAFKYLMYNYYITYICIQYILVKLFIPKSRPTHAFQLFSLRRSSAGLSHCRGGRVGGCSDVFKTEVQLFGTKNWSA